jgi:23S rRNA (guanosine2251-2'-O)-methyltransferase
MIVYGINPVLEALRAGRVKAIRLSARSGPRVDEIIGRAGEAGVAVSRVAADVLNREAGGRVHQGVVADLRPAAEPQIDDIVRGRGEPSLIVVLDGIEDPQNVGSILRSADAAGVAGVVRQSRHAAALGPAAAKASAGAVAHVPIVTVVNITRALEELKRAGIWTVGLAADGPIRYDQVDLRLPTALVVGAEGTGLRRLVREHCDVLAAIPMHGRVASLNVSAATAVVLFEARRQRATMAEGPRWNPTLQTP